MHFFEDQNWTGAALLLIGKAFLIGIAAAIACLIVASFWQSYKKTRPPGDRCSTELPLD